MDRLTVVHVPHSGYGLLGALNLLHTWQQIGGHAGKVVAAMLDGPDDIAITLDQACPRCGHYDPLDITRTLTGDHLKAVHGPMSVERVAADQCGNTITFRATEPYILVWCSRFEETMAELRPEFEREAT